MVMRFSRCMMAFAALAMMAGAMADERIEQCIRQYEDSGRSCKAGECIDIWNNCHTWDKKRNTWGWKEDDSCEDENIDVYSRSVACWECRIPMSMCPFDSFNITRSELDTCREDLNRCANETPWLRNTVTDIRNDCDKRICPVSGQHPGTVCYKWCVSTCPWYATWFDGCDDICAEYCNLYLL